MKYISINEKTYAVQFISSGFGDACYGVALCGQAGKGECRVRLNEEKRTVSAPFAKDDLMTEEEAISALRMFLAEKRNEFLDWAAKQSPAVNVNEYPPTFLLAA